MSDEGNWDGKIGRKSARVENRIFSLYDHVAFVKKCRKEDFKPFIYEGRFSYIGPAILLPTLVDVSRLGLTIALDWDHFGKNYVVHPALSDNEKETERIEALKWRYQNDYDDSMHKNL